MVAHLAAYLAGDWVDDWAVWMACQWAARKVSALAATKDGSAERLVGTWAGQTADESAAQWAGLVGWSVSH